MDAVSVILVAAALSMDAFAASLCLGISIRKAKARHILKAGIYFGFFQGIMPVIGYFPAKAFSGFIRKIDHWIAFSLLAAIGINMLVQARRETEETADENSFSHMKMLATAVATSVDALAVGASFAMTGNVNIASAACVIALTAFVFCAAGVKIGNAAGMRFRRKAEIFGGCTLILIGLNILSGHIDI